LEALCGATEVRGLVLATKKYLKKCLKHFFDFVCPSLHDGLFFYVTTLREPSIHAMMSEPC
jgi:hypothetical protein